jgi:LysM repeat protein/predicted small secreted protein
MSRERLLTPCRLIIVLILVALGLSACYKDAGEDVQPTSNRVNLSDIAATTSAPTIIPFTTPTPTIPAPATLVPTTTPFGTSENIPPTTIEPLPASPTNSMPGVLPSFTPLGASSTPTTGLVTPGMSDILPTFTPMPTLNPVLQPTPTGLPVEQNECIHVVQSGDTLYSIAQTNGVLLADLVAANPTLLGGSEYTPLQIGWELQIPGCSVATPTPAATIEEAATPAGATENTYVVQGGDTIYSIARKFGVSPDAIVTANGLSDPDHIYPGQTLIIPPAQ